MVGDRSYSPGEASHRALRAIQRELERHPVVVSTQGFPSGQFTEIVAEIATDRLEIDTEEATLTARWFAGERRDDRSEFVFHFSYDDGDCGWHHEPNPHVDGWGHFQERSSGKEYSYEPYEFGSTTPSRVVWEVLEQVERYE